VMYRVSKQAKQQEMADVVRMLKQPGKWLGTERGVD
jgi:hypothetical protein